MQEIIHILMAKVELGPFSEKQVRKYLVEGDLLLSDLARLDPKAEWVPLSQVLEKLPPPEPEPSAVAAVAELPNPPIAPPSLSVGKTSAPESPAPIIPSPPNHSVTPPPLPAATTPRPSEPKASAAPTPSVPVNPLASVSTQWSWVAAFAPPATAAKREESPAKAVPAEPVPEKKTASPEMVTPKSSAEGAQPTPSTVQPPTQGTGSLASIREKLAELLVGKLPNQQSPREQKPSKSQLPEPAVPVEPVVVENVAPKQERAPVISPVVEKDKVLEKSPAAPPPTQPPMIQPAEAGKALPAEKDQDLEKPPVVSPPTQARTIRPEQPVNALLPSPAEQTRAIVPEAVTPSVSDPEKWLWIPPVIPPQSKPTAPEKKTGADLHAPPVEKVATEASAKLNPRGASQMRPFKAKIIVPEPDLTRDHTFKLGDREDQYRVVYVLAGLGLLLTMVVAVEWDVVSSGLSGVWSSINFYLYQTVTLFAHKI